MQDAPPPRPDADLGSAAATGADSGVPAEALRFLTVGLDGRGRDAARRLMRRAAMLTKVEHPHLVAPLSAATDGTGIATFAFPPVRGELLTDVASGLSAAEADAVAAHALIALNHLHELGLAVGGVTAEKIRVERDSNGVWVRIEVDPTAPSDNAVPEHDARSLAATLRARLVATTPALREGLAFIEAVPRGTMPDLHRVLSMLALSAGARFRPRAHVPLPVPNVHGHFVGREAVLGRVLAAVEAAGTPDGDRRVVVVGPRGAGKSAVLTEAGWALEASGVRVRRGRCGDPEVPLIAGLFPNSEGRFAGVVDVCAETRDGRLVLVIDDVHAAGAADVEALRRLIDVASTVPVVLLLAAEDAEAGGVTPGASLVAGAPAERLRGLSARDVAEWIGATGLGARAMTDLATAFDEGRGFLPGTVARRLLGAYTGLVAPFIDTPPQGTGGPRPDARALPPRLLSRTPARADDAGIRFLARLAEALSTATCKDDVLRLALPMIREVAGAVAVALVGRDGATVEAGDARGDGGDWTPFLRSAEALLASAGEKRLTPIADAASGVVFFPFLGLSEGGGIAVLSGFESMVPGFADRRQLVALAGAQVGQALAILGSEARRRDAEIVGLENAWLREVSKRAAGESERVRTLHESLRTRTAELERVSASLRGLFDALSEHGVVAWDAEGRPTAKNATATALYGAGVDDGATFDALREGGLPTFASLADEARTQGRATVEGRRFRADGTVVHVQLTLTPLRATDGSVCGFVEVSRDLSVEIDRRNRAVLSERLASLGTLSAGVAHEFNNLLQGIMGWLEHAMAVDDRTTARRAVATALGAAARASEVTRRLQAFARPRGETRVPTRLSELVDETLRLVGRGLEAEGCRLETVHENGVTASVNETQLLQVVLNLVTNARHAMAGVSDRRLSVGTRREGGFAVISVGDSGPGIAADVLPRIFDPFFSTKGVYGESRVAGMGLGLSMARSIVEDHGGTLAVHGGEGAGAVFEIRLPALAPELHVPSRRLDAEGPAIAAKPLSVLIVDGDVAVRESLAERLCLRGHIVALAQGAAEASAVLGRGGVDVVVIDGEEGRARATLERLGGASGQGANVRFVLIGDGAEGDVSREERYDVLRKPFTAATWVTTVEGSGLKG